MQAAAMSSSLDGEHSAENADEPTQDRTEEMLLLEGAPSCGYSDMIEIGFYKNFIGVLSIKLSCYPDVMWGV